MLLRSMVFLGFLFAGGAAWPATILVWGDSLSAGYGLRADEAWPSLLETRLQREGLDATVVNGSVSGETTAGGLSRLPAAIERTRPDVLVLALGANDGLRGLPPQLMGRNLRAMIDAAQDAGAKVLLVGMRLPPNYGQRYAARFQQTFDEVARAAQVPLLPFLLEPIALDRAMFQGDGLHPTAEAQPILRDLVWSRLAPLLGRRR